jgi:hypothetical protein
MNASANKSPNKIPAKSPGTQVIAPASATKKLDLSASTKKGAIHKVVNNPKESVPMSSGVAAEPKKRGRKSAKESASVDSRPGSAPTSGRKAAGKKSGAA